jgi:nicotinamidase-related amidase
MEMFMPERAVERLTADNTAVILVDHQIGLLTGVRDISTGELKHNVVALAKSAKALGLPIVVASTAAKSMWGPTFSGTSRGTAGHRGYRPLIGEHL